MEDHGDSEATEKTTEALVITTDGRRFQHASCDQPACDFPRTSGLRREIKFCPSLDQLFMGSER